MHISRETLISQEMWVLLDMYRRFQTSFGLKDRRIKKSFFLVMNTSAKRRVAFAEGTLPPREAIIALSIVRHENLEHLGYTEYTIQVRKIRAYFVSVLLW